MAHEDSFACSFYLALKGVNMHELEETSPIIVSSRVSHICYFFSKKQSPHMDFFLGKIYHFSTRMQNVYIFTLDWKDSLPQPLLICMDHGADESYVHTARVAESVRGHGGPRRKVWTRTKILSPNIRYFVAKLDLSRFTHFLEIFVQKQCLFGSKTVCLGQEVHYYKVYIAYYTEFLIMRKNNAYVAKIANTHMTKTCMPIFALEEMLPTSATL